MLHISKDETLVLSSQIATCKVVPLWPNAVVSHGVLKVMQTDT